MKNLFTPIQLGSLELPNRVFMAPLTRCRADAGNVPSDLAVEYYRQRASAGVIITEATSVSPRGYGYPNTPGIFNEAHIAGWRKVTNAGHAAGGENFRPPLHVWRNSHPGFPP